MPDFEYGAAEAAEFDVPPSAVAPIDSQRFLALGATQAQDAEYTLGQLRDAIGVKTLAPVADVAARDALLAVVPLPLKTGYIVPVTDADGNNNAGDSLYTGVPARPWVELWRIGQTATGFTDRGQVADDTARDALTGVSDGHYVTNASDGKTNLFLDTLWFKLGDAAPAGWRTILNDAGNLDWEKSTSIIGGAAGSPFTMLLAPGTEGNQMTVRNNSAGVVILDAGPGRTFAEAHGSVAGTQLMPLLPGASTEIHRTATRRLIDLMEGITTQPPATVNASYYRGLIRFDQGAGIFERWQVDFNTAGEPIWVQVNNTPGGGVTSFLALTEAPPAAGADGERLAWSGGNLVNVAAGATGPTIAREKAVAGNNGAVIAVDDVRSYLYIDLFDGGNAMSLSQIEERVNNAALCRDLQIILRPPATPANTITYSIAGLAPAGDLSIPSMPQDRDLRLQVQFDGPAASAVPLLTAYN